MTVMTRKRFVAVGAGAVPAALLLGMFGCGDDDDEDDDGGTAPTTGGPDGTTGPGMTTAPATTTDGATTAAETTGGVTTTGGADATGTTEAPDDTTGADGTTGTTGAAVCEGVESEVGAPNQGPPHDHMVMVPADDVAAGEEVTYMTTLDAGHLHEITVTTDMFASLAAGETVMVDTLPDATGHTHPVTLACE